MINNGYLAHYGIIGMKWGIRRYQNPNGSLTEEGKKRYQIPEGDHTKAEKNKYRSEINNLIDQNKKQRRDIVSDYSSAQRDNNRLYRKKMFKALGRDKDGEIIRSYRNIDEANRKNAAINYYENKYYEKQLKLALKQLKYGDYSKQVLKGKKALERLNVNLGDMIVTKDPKTGEYKVIQYEIYAIPLG